MSYNITCVKGQKIEDLKIPLKAFFLSERKDWHPKVVTDAGWTTLECGCEQTIEGYLDSDENLYVDKMNLSGEGSGSFFHYVLERAFKESKGSYSAVWIWEGGDSIDKFCSNDGVVKFKKYDFD